jgi:3-oxoacyl-[acyl-carrier protein] reductase
MGRLDGRVAIITGSGKGIGKATAQRFAKEGARVVIATRSEAPGRETLESITRDGGEALLHVVDIGDRSQCRDLVARTAEHFGGIDIVLHNAAYTEGGRIETTPDDKLALTFDVGLMPCFWLTADALPHLKKSRAPRVLVTSSIMGPRITRAGRTHYCAMKTAMNGFVRSAAAELARHRITVNAVEPGTTFADSIDRLVPPEYLSEMIARIPLGRGVNADEIALGFVYLASDDAAMVTGVSLIIDGGESAGFDTPFVFDDH